MKRRKTLIVLTTLEVVLFLVTLYIMGITSSYNFDVALESFTEPWLGSRADAIENRYNVSLMQTLNIICEITGLLWILSNGIRFVLIKPIRRWYFIIGVLLFFMGGFFAQMTYGISMIGMFAGFYYIALSHKLDKYEEDMVSFKSLAE